MPPVAPIELEFHVRRQYLRVPGPFDGRWLGLIAVPIRIFDLSVGGCLVQTYHAQAPDRRLTLEIELPYEGWLQLEGRSLKMRSDDGFPVRFVNVPPDVGARLRTAIDKIAAQAETTP
jgi:hypothetical protein